MIPIADTGFLIALTLRTDRHNAVCRKVYSRYPHIILPQSVLTETAYFPLKKAGHQIAARFLFELPTTQYDIVPLEPPDLRRTAELLRKYADTRVDFVDASVAAVAERLGITQVLTLDRRDFEIIRPLHAEYFEILPVHS